MATLYAKELEMERNAWNAGMPWPSPLLYQQSATAPTHYHLHNFQNFEGTNFCPRFPPPHCAPSNNGGNIRTQHYERESDSDSEDHGSGSYTYLVKIINPKKKSDYIVRMWHGVSEAFKTPTTLREKLREAFPHDIPSSTDFQVGYLEGNTKRWIVEERDLSAMYDSFDDGSKITMWCDGRGEGADTSKSEGVPAPKRRKTDSQDVPSLSEMADDDDVYKKLKAKHPDMANPKLRLWAKLISRGRYDDYDNIPPIPLLQGDSSGGKKTKKNSLSEALVDAAVVFAQTFQASHVANSSPQSATGCSGMSSKMSPMKYAQLRRSSLEDLKTLKSLYEDNVISENEFADEKERILSTLKSVQ